MDFQIRVLNQNIVHLGKVFETLSQELVIVQDFLTDKFGADFSLHRERHLHNSAVACVLPSSSSDSLDTRPIPLKRSKALSQIRRRALRKKSTRPVHATITSQPARAPSSPHPPPPSETVFIISEEVDESGTAALEHLASSSIAVEDVKIVTSLENVETRHPEHTEGFHTALNINDDPVESDGATEESDEDEDYDADSDVPGELNEHTRSNKTTDANPNGDGEPDEDDPYNVRKYYIKVLAADSRRNRLECIHCGTQIDNRSTRLIRHLNRCRPDIGKHFANYVENGKLLKVTTAGRKLNPIRKHFQLVNASSGRIRATCKYCFRQVSNRSMRLKAHFKDCVRAQMEVNGLDVNSVIN